MKYVITSFLILVLGLLGVFKPLQTAVVFIVSPIQFGLTQTAVSLKSATNFFSDANKVRQENLRLLDQVTVLNQELADLKTVRDENNLLKQQLELSGGVGSAKLILAEVMGNPADLSESTVLINKGTRDGVRTNDLIVVGNYLVGITRNVDYSRSVVELITSSNLSLTAYDLDSPDKAAGLLKGEHGSVLSLERILQNEKVVVGDTVVTSGKDGIFIPNLVVGKVVDVQSDPSQPLKRATLHTMVDVGKLINVFILQKE